MRAHTQYLWFTTRSARELINITDRIADIVESADIAEGFCLVSAMHITSGIWVNDEESGLKEDLHDHALLPLAVELGVEHLLPRAEIELSGRDRQHHLVMDEGALEMRVAVVLTGAVVAVVGVRRQPVEPLDQVLLEAALLVVHPDAGRDVHRRHEA